jgi:Uma2 family endonuclease
MAASIQPAIDTLSIEEYLRTYYKPDCDFVDGRLEERNVGETKHGVMQMHLGFWFISHQKEWRLEAIAESRTRVSDSCVRIPDVSVVPLDDDSIQEAVRITPPLIAIEILSREDRMSRVVRRLDDFVRMGIRNVWLLDPHELAAYTYSQSGLKLVESDRIEVPSSPAYLDLAQIFDAVKRSGNK